MSTDNQQPPVLLPVRAAAISLAFDRLEKINGRTTGLKTWTAIVAICLGVYTHRLVQPKLDQIQDRLDIIKSDLDEIQISLQRIEEKLPKQPTNGERPGLVAPGSEQGII